MIRTLLCLFGVLAFGNVCLSAPVTVTLSVDPTSGRGSIIPKLTWSSTGAASCVATGGWSGTKALQGTETLPAIVNTTKWTLTCASATGPAKVTWTAPTLNEDGTPLTNLTGYKLAYNATPNVDQPAPVVTLGPALTSTTVEAPPGKQYFVMRSSAGAVDSARTDIVSTTVVADTAAKEATTTVQVLPNPPTNFTVQ